MYERIYVRKRRSSLGTWTYKIAKQLLGQTLPETEISEQFPQVIKHCRKYTEPPCRELTRTAQEIAPEKRAVTMRDIRQ